METIQTVSTHDVVCFVLETHLWSGRIQLRAEDLKKFSSANTSLPDSALASLGSVKICDPEVTRTFEKLKREAQAVLEEAGLNLFKARAVPTHRHAEVRDKLNNIKDRFELEAKKLLATYTTKVGEWRAKWLKANPGYGHLLDRIPSAESVFGRLSFEYHDYRVEPPKGAYDDEAGTEFTTKLSGLRGELYKEAATEAITLIESTMDKTGGRREYITPKTLGPFKRIASRFRDFQNVDPSAIAAAELIDATVSQALAFAQTDKNNRISDGPLMIVLSMAQTFANPAAAARLAEKSRMVGTEDVFDELLQIGSVSGEMVMKQDITATSHQAAADAAKSTGAYEIASVRPEAAPAHASEVVVEGSIVEVISQQPCAVERMSSIDMFEASIQQHKQQRNSDATSAVLTQLVSQAKASHIEVIDVREVNEAPATPGMDAASVDLGNTSPAPLTESSIQVLLSF